jgi:hypothetical protein
LNKHNVEKWAGAVFTATLVPASKTPVERKPFASVGVATTREARPCESESNAQIVRRLNLKKGDLVRLPDDCHGQPVRKAIKNVDGNGMVTFGGNRKQFPARAFLPR